MLFETDLNTIVSKGSLNKRFTTFPSSAKVIHRSGTQWLINPESRKYQIWEFLIVFVTCYTTVVTPFEVSFLDPEITVNGLFVMNLTIDFIFLTDTFLTFFLPFFDSKTGLWVNSRPKIARNYITGRFLLDFIPSLPYDLISILVMLAGDRASSEVGALKSLRILRVLKVLKIVRLAKLGNIYRKYQDRIPLKYTTVTLIKFAVIMLLFSHWLACILRSIPTVENSDYFENWVGGYFFNNYGLSEEEVTVFAEYVVAFYWAVMTLTTVGYGDVTAQTDFERIAVSIAMLVGAILYAFIVGSICGLIASMRKRDAEFFENLDEMDEYMKKENLPQYLRIKIRNFYYFSETKRTFDQYKHIVETLTPSLQEEISTFRNHRFLLRVPFVSCAPLSEVNQFVIALSVKLTLEVFPPFEVLLRKGQLISSFFIVKSGALLLHISPKVELDENDEPEDSVKKGNIYYRDSYTSTLKIKDGSCFGHEIILEEDIYAHYYASALGYCELYKLTKADLHSVLKGNTFYGTKRNIRDLAKRFEHEDTNGSIDGIFSFQHATAHDSDEPVSNKSSASSISKA